MPIQFACPSCAQPIEVDGIHAGRNALCPYCRREVVVPAESTYAPAQVTARPAGSGQPAGPTWDVPVPRSPHHSPSDSPRSNPYAAWALVVSVAAILCFGILMFSAIRLVLPLAPAPGTAMTDEDSERMQKALAEQAPGSRESSFRRC
ncbi:MAG: hypothetical protein IPM64_04905 [Phycisphaerales bacterium]|nr:hypothetical protein [Phycisphaerales bacterium]